MKIVLIKTKQLYKRYEKALIYKQINLLAIKTNE